MLVLLLAAAGACYRPKIADCAIRCEAATGCPSPLRCIEGTCTHGPAACPAQSDGGGDVIPDAQDDVPIDMGGDVSMDHRPAYDRPEVSFDKLPTAINNLVLWLDPEVGVDQVPGMLIWHDRSDTHSDALADDPVRPTRLPAADGYPPMFELSGTNQYFSLPAGMRRVGQIFIVAEPRMPRTTNPDASIVLPDLMQFLDFSLGDLKAAIRYGIDDKQLVYVTRNGAGDPEIPEAISDPNGNYTGELQLFEVRAEGAGISSFTRITVEHHKNGRHVGDTGTLVPVTTLDRTVNFIGRSSVAGESYFHGLLCEVIVYGGGLTPDERKVVEDYLIGKWNLRDMR
jgi:hypothetical protein